MIIPHPSLVFASFLGIALTSAPALAQRSIDDPVNRSPQIIVPGLSELGVNVEVSCQGGAYGPAEVAVEAGSVGTGFFEITTSRMQPAVVERWDCESFRQAYASGLQRQIAVAFARFGQTTNWVATPDVTVRVDLYPQVITEFVGERTDTAQDQTCTAQCGRASCRNYQMKLENVERVRVVGPAYDGQPQGDEASYPNTIGTYAFVACNDERAAGQWRETAPPLLSGGESQVISEIGLWAGRLFGGSIDTFTARRANVRRSDGARDAAELFDHGRYAEAAQAYLNAFAGEGVELSDENQSDLLYNAALAALLCDDLETAASTANRALGIRSSPGVRDLIGEIQTRGVDTRRFEALGSEIRP